ncbi:co-chaperone HscB [soil metagenome]
MNYFELFEVPVSFIVDQKELSTKYFELQKKFHPDFFTNADEEEKSKVLEQSSVINKAYKTFKDTQATIKYVLQLKELIADDEKYDLPPDFLMEMMELNESLSDDDVLSTEEAKTKIAQLEQELYKEVQSIIEGYDDERTTDAQMLLVKEYYYKKKYLNRILERLEGMRNIASQN